MSKFYITTSIPYVNAPPHIGHALEFLQADTIARYRRGKGDDVFFLTGTDEHGAKIARAAEALKKTPQEFVQENAKLFSDLVAALSVEPDTAIRTSDQKRHWPGAQELWRRIVKQGDIYKGNYKGLYCVGHEAFVTEKDLKNGICEDHGKPPEYIEEENYFFRLSEYSEMIRKHIENNEVKILPEHRRAEVLAFLREGASDISFSRPAEDISWGIPVPDDIGHTMYVWCDALSNYLTGLGFGSGSLEMFEKYWPCDVHVIGKDIVRFHAVIWLGMLLSAGLPLPKCILVHGFIHTGGKKMSKSLGNVIDPFMLVQKYGSEAVRYILLGNVPVFNDGDLTVDRIHDIYTAHLANGIGNLVSRVAAMAEQYFGGHVERPSDISLAALPLKTNIDILGIKTRDLEVGSSMVSHFLEHTTFARHAEAMQEYRLDEALQEVMRLYRVLDGYIQDYEPYKLVKNDKEQAQAVLWNVLYALHGSVSLLVPFMPETAERIANILGVKTIDAFDVMRKEYDVSKPQPLFPRVEGPEEEFVI